MYGDAHDITAIKRNLEYIFNKKKSIQSHHEGFTCGKIFGAVSATNLS